MAPLRRGGLTRMPLSLRRMHTSQALTPSFSAITTAFSRPLPRTSFTRSVCEARSCSSDRRSCPIASAFSANCSSTSTCAQTARRVTHAREGRGSRCQHLTRGIDMHQTGHSTLSTGV